MSLCCDAGARAAARNRPIERREAGAGLTWRLTVARVVGFGAGSSWAATVEVLRSFATVFSALPAGFWRLSWILEVLPLRRSGRDFGFLVVTGWAGSSLSADELRRIRRVGLVCADARRRARLEGFLTVGAGFFLSLIGHLSLSTLGLSVSAPP